MLNFDDQWQISGTDKFAKVIDFLRRQLHKETLVFCPSLICYCICGPLLKVSFLALCSQFVYVNSAFSPNPDQLIIDLYDVSIQLKYCEFTQVFFLISFSSCSCCCQFES